MRISELIDILRDKPSDADVEIAFVTPVDDDANEIVVNHFDVSAIFSPSEDSVLLISGEDDDVDELIDALEAGDELDAE
ncbi:MAG: hypothetical protein ACO3ME_11630 [Ilumatobacteraceae bacterium]|jgi:hypothetical protein|nr:hypothetical protein [Actinomycetota bacterium]